MYEKTIIYKYTEDGYENVNQALRNGKSTPPLGIHLINSLKKLPNYKRLCYRAVELGKKELHKYYDAMQKGTTITERSSLSCSKSKSIALAFCQSPLFIILSKRGKDIEKIAKLGYIVARTKKKCSLNPVQSLESYR